MTRYILTFLASLLALPSLVFAAPATIENFNALSTGNLSGQNGWTCTDSTFVVEGTVYHDYSKGIISTSTLATACGKNVATSTSGVYGFWLNSGDITSTNEFRLRNSSSATRVSVGISNNAAFYRDNSATGFQFASSLSIFQWHFVEVQIDTTNDRYRTRIDGGSTTGWITMQTSGGSAIAQVRMVNAAGSPANGSIYIDTITYDATGDFDATTTVASTVYSPTQDEFLFLSFIMLFIGGYFFWQHVLSPTRGRWDVGAFV